MTDFEQRVRVALIAPSYSYRVFAYQAAAERLGIELVVASDGEFSLLPRVHRGVHIPLEDEVSSYEKLIAIGSQEQWNAILSSDDRFVELAAEVSQTLNLSNNPPESARLTRRKDLARAFLRKASVPVPDAHVIRLDADISSQIIDVNYPCVAKPVSLSASRGVIRANCRETLLTAVERIRGIVSDAIPTDTEESRLLLIESYVPGIEIAIEGLVNQGKLRVIAIFDKPDPLEGPYFEETYYITPSRLPDYQLSLAVSAVRQAVKAYCLVTGPIHAEVRISQHRVWIIEIASRTIGGDCARLLDYRLGRSLEELVLLNAIGKYPRFDEKENAAGVLMIPVPKAGTLRRVEGIMQASNVPYIEELSIMPRTGYELIPLPEGASYLGFIFARAPTSALVENALREAHKALNIVIAPRWALLPA